MSLFRPRSRISREVNSQIYNLDQQSAHIAYVRTRTDGGNSRITLLRTLRYRSEVHSENLEGKVEIWLCDSASLRVRGVSCVLMTTSRTR